jgi:L-ascorbate metabolism protein UlaG (beta-lactamase superfamily)
MGSRQAARACSLLGVSSVVPMHYATFPILAGTPDELRTSLAGGITTLSGDRGEAGETF